MKWPQRGAKNTKTIPADYIVYLKYSYGIFTTRCASAEAQRVTKSIILCVSVISVVKNTKFKDLQSTGGLRAC